MRRTPMDQLDFEGFGGDFGVSFVSVMYVVLEQSATYVLTSIDLWTHRSPQRIDQRVSETIGKLKHSVCTLRAVQITANMTMGGLRTMMWLCRSLGSNTRFERNQTTHTGRGRNHN